MSSNEHNGESNLPVVPDSTQIEQQIETNSAFIPASIASARNMSLQTPTPSRYIELKNEYPYVKSNYVADLFWKLYPNHRVKITNSEVFQQYWFIIDVEIEVEMPNGDRNVQCGTGGSRIQISKKAKEEFLETGKVISPFDYIEVGNARKAALTLAIKNAQEKFGIGHDALDKIILTDEEVAEISKAFNEMIALVADPRQQSKIKARWAEAKSIASKFRILEHLKELTQ